MDFLASPKGNQEHLPSVEDLGQEEDGIKIRLFFHGEAKKLHNQMFPEDWYIVAKGQYGEDEVSQDFEPWVEVSELAFHH